MGIWEGELYDTWDLRWAKENRGMDRGMSECRGTWSGDCASTLSCFFVAWHVYMGDDGITTQQLFSICCVFSLLSLPFLFPPSLPASASF